MRLYLIPDKEKVFADCRLEAASKTAFVQAKIIRKYDRKTYLRIWNSGGMTAYNVRFYIPEKRRICVLKCRNSYDALGSGKAFDEYMIADDDIEGSITIITTWEDYRGITFSMEQKGYISKAYVC